MNRHPLVAALLWVAPFPIVAADMANNVALVARAQQRWEQSAHGAWLSRILPPSTRPARLPEAESRGAQLLLRYCVQCHHLPSPTMHHAERWSKIVDRMVLRMMGRGNMGALMKDMMASVAAPGEEETHDLLDYLQRNAQEPIRTRRYPDLATAGRSFREACSQCHVLPDPASRRRSEWRGIVERMSRNIQWMNRVVGSRPDAREPQFAVDEIVGYLERNAQED